MSAPDIFVVALTRNGAPTVTRGIESVLASEGVTVDFVVVDNASTDGSGERLARRFGEEHVLRIAANTGYTGGMNAGIARWRERGGESHLLLMTQDMTLDPSALGRMLAALRANPGAGLAGPLVLYRDDAERVFSAGGRIEPRRARSYQLRELAGHATYPVDWIDGCCMLIRPEVIEAIGGLDDRYFIYFEETDFCRRAGAAGWSILLVPEARAWQEKDTIPAPYYFYFMARNRYLFWRKNYGVGGAVVALTLARELAGLAKGVVLPPGGRSRSLALRWLLRHARGTMLGTRDYVRGRFGPAPEMR